MSSPYFWAAVSMFTLSLSYPPAFFLGLLFLFLFGVQVGG